MRERVPRRHPRRPSLSDSLQHRLLSGAQTGDDLESFDADLPAAWREHSPELLAVWIRAHPGTRPWAWWRFAAPEPRQRLGGVGTPAAEVLAYAPEFHVGIPADWVESWMVAYYTGRARDVHGRPIGQEFQGRPFEGRAIDPDDPPRFESEAAYLERLGLLTDEERRRLPRAAFEAEVVTVGRIGDGEEEEEEEA